MSHNSIAATGFDDLADGTIVVFKFKQDDDDNNDALFIQVGSKVDGTPGENWREARVLIFENYPSPEGVVRVLNDLALTGWGKETYDLQMQDRSGTFILLFGMVLVTTLPPGSSKHEEVAEWLKIPTPDMISSLMAQFAHTA